MDHRQFALCRGAGARELAQLLELRGHRMVLAELGGKCRFSMLMVAADPEMVGTVSNQRAAMAVGNHLRVHGGLERLAQNRFDTGEAIDFVKVAARNKSENED